MTQEKVTAPTAAQKLEALTNAIAQEREAKEQNLIHAAMNLDEHGAASHRRLFMEMSLKFCADRRNDVDEEEILSILQIHEILNVL